MHYTFYKKLLILYLILTNPGECIRIFKMKLVFNFSFWIHEYGVIFVRKSKFFLSNNLVYRKYTLVQYFSSENIIFSV